MMRQMTRFVMRRAAGCRWRPAMSRWLPSEVARYEVVETSIVDAREAVGAIGVRPDPLGEARLDLDQLFLGRFGGFDVENAALAAIDDLDIEDLRCRAVESVVEKLSGMTARSAPFRRAGGVAGERAAVDRPGCDFLVWRILTSPPITSRANTSITSVGDPRRAEAGSDPGGWHVLRLAFPESQDVPLELPVQGGDGFGRC